MNREKIREKTMQLIFQMDATGDFDYSQLHTVEEVGTVVGQERARAVLEAVKDHISDIDAVIESNLEKWTLDRVSRTDLAILRTAVAEMMYVESIPVRVSINEAVKLSRRYGDDKSYAFVNSVLGKISRALDEPQNE